MNEPHVFIIIINWNGKDIALECLSSLRQLSYTNYAIVLVDNASTDDSVQAVKQSAPDVTVLEMTQNLRFAGGNNRGIRYALETGADYILLLNNDTTVDRHCLSHMVSRMQSDRCIGMVSPKIYYHSRPDTIWYAGGRISTWMGIMYHLGIRERDRGQYDSTTDLDFATGCCVLVSRELVERIGTLDESYYMYSEDADWSMRSRRAGYRIVFEPKATVWHKVSVTAGGDLSWYKLKNKFLSNMRFFGRYSAWYQWPVFPWMSMLINAGLTTRELLALHRRP